MTDDFFSAADESRLARLERVEDLIQRIKQEIRDGGPLGGHVLEDLAPFERKIWEETTNLYAKRGRYNRCVRPQVATP